MTKHRTLIVGAGHAGGRAAEALRAADPDREIVVIGQESHLPYERPPLSKDLLLGSMETSATYVFAEEWYAEHSIDLIRGKTVASIDRQKKRLALADGRFEPYDTLLLTTGARARQLNIPISGSSSIFYLRTLQDCLALRDRLSPGVRVGIIGAGFIGLEVAATATKRGCLVTVVEAAQQALGRVVDRQIGEWIGRVHEAQGVDMIFGAGVSAIESAVDGHVIEFKDGRHVPVDLIVVGIGAVPNVELAQAASLDVQDGIITDEFGRTADQDIWAAGDCTRHFNPIYSRHLRLETWHNAQNQAIAVAKAMAGPLVPYAEIPWFWSDQYDIRLQSLGVAPGGATLYLRGSIESGSFIAFSVQHERIINATGAGRPKEFAAVRRLMQAGSEVEPDILIEDTTDLVALAKSRRIPMQTSIPA